MKKLSLAALATVAVLSINALKPTAYRVDTQKSTLQWTGRKVVSGQHSGTINLSSGTLVLDGNTPKSGQFAIDMNTINVTDDMPAEQKAKLKGHLTSDDFFGVSGNPAARFTITNVTPKGGNQYDITGTLSLKGKNSTVTFPATVDVSGNTATANATVTFDRSKHDVKFGSKSFFADLVGDKVISDDITMNVKLVATR